MGRKTAATRDDEALRRDIYAAVEAQGIALPPDWPPLEVVKFLAASYAFAKKSLDDLDRKILHGCMGMNCSKCDCN